MRYDEPTDWYFPVRHLLGPMLLEAGRDAAAEALFRADLERNPENGWALTGLAAALRRQGRENEAAAADRRLAFAWSRADLDLDRLAAPPPSSPRERRRARERRRSAEPRRRVGREVDRRTLAEQARGDEVGARRREQDAVAVVAGGVEEPWYRARPEDRQPVGGRRTEVRPRFEVRRRGELGGGFDRHAENAAAARRR